MKNVSISWVSPLNQTQSQYMFFRKTISKIIQKHEENIFLKYRKNWKFENFLGLASQPDTISAYFFIKNPKT
jgi:hypothetical protein